jgi:FkbM family methyltransferase
VSTIRWIINGFFLKVEKRVRSTAEVYRTKGTVPSLIYAAKFAYIMLDYFFNLKNRQFDIPFISATFDRDRSKIRAIATKHTKHPDKTIERIANYACEKDLSKNSIVYSFGISKDIDFEKQIINSKNCKVYAYDPTPSSKIFTLNEIKKLELENMLFFKQEGLWVEDGIQKFFIENDSSDEGSITNLTQSDSSYEIQCHTLETLMKNNGHQSIDLLKMDIEGAAIKVLRSWIDMGTFIPNSIACEIEHPKHDDLWFNEVSDVLIDLQKINFEIFYLSRRVQYRGLDLFLRRTSNTA